MSQSLAKLVDIGTFNILQEKLEDWFDNFKFNTCDENVARGCEIIELNAKVQSELFKLLSLCASEGGVYGGASVIKSKLLPILGQSYFAAGMSTNSSLKELGEITPKIKKLNDVKRNYEKSLNDFQYDLKESQSENETLRMELEEAKIELDRQERQSSSEKMFDKQEIDDIKDQLDNIKSENNILRSKANLTESYELELEHLKDDVAILSTHRGFQTSRCFSQCTLHHSVFDPCYKSGCPLDSCYCYSDYCDPLCFAKQKHLVSKFNDLFSLSRTEAMNILCRYSENHENNQKIIFHAVMESFNISKSVFRTYKSKIRSGMNGHHSGYSLEEYVQRYITDYAENDIDIAYLCKDVVQALDLKTPLISRPSGLSFDVIGSFIREACKIAWNMCNLPDTLDVYHPASEGELFDETRYRRSYDSENDALFVSHHVWPCLIKNRLIIAKGEAVTKRIGSNSKLLRSGRKPVISSTLSSDSYSLPSSIRIPITNVRSKSPLSKQRF